MGLCWKGDPKLFQLLWSQAGVFCAWYQELMISGGVLAGQVPVLISKGNAVWSDIFRVHYFILFLIIHCILFYLPFLCGSDFVLGS